MPSRARWMMLRGFGTWLALLAAFGVTAAHAGPRVDATVVAITDGDTLRAELRCRRGTSCQRPALAPPASGIGFGRSPGPPRVCAPATSDAPNSPRRRTGAPPRTACAGLDLRDRPPVAAAPVAWGVPAGLIPHTLLPGRDEDDRELADRERPLLGFYPHHAAML
jgi:hypothetical protein